MTEKAKKNYDMYFDEMEKLVETDPEFMEVFYNFNYDEVASANTLPVRTRMLVVLATLITNQSVQLYQKEVEGALKVGLSPIEIKEVLYQAIPYVGYAKGYDFLQATNDVFRAHDISLPLEGQSTTTRENRHELGLKKQFELFGEERIQANRENASADEFHFQEFLADYCFGDFYTRTGLNNQDRELITFAIIASLRGCENQLRGHTAANLGVGNTKEILIGAITVLCPYIGFPRTLNALSIVNEICK